MNLCSALVTLGFIGFIEINSTEQSADQTLYFIKVMKQMIISEFFSSLPLYASIEEATRGFSLIAPDFLFICLSSYSLGQIK